MEFRIKSIFLIPKNPEKSIRTIEFALDKVNVITGGSEKGKSTLIAIVDYCLGSSKCRIPTRKIRNYTEWFGLHITLANNQELIIARKEPGELIASGDMFMKEGTNLIVPNAILGNCNVNEVKTRLNNLAGLSGLNFAEEGSKIGFESHPSFRDFVSFLFQPQYIIANQSSLFYRTDQMAQRQKLISIFNYVLQAVDNTYLELKEELKQIDRDLNDLNKEIDKKTRSINRWIGQLRGYFNQAKEFGLLKDDGYPEENWGTLDYINKLKKVPEELNSLTSFQVSVDSVAITSNRISELTSLELNIAYDIQNLKHRQELLNRLIEGNSNYRDDLLQQHGRLKTSSWFNQLLSKHEEECPFCLSKTNNGKKYIAKLIKTNNEIISKGTQLNDNVTVLKGEQRKVSSQIRMLLTRLNEARQELSVLKRSGDEDNKRLNTINSIYRFGGMIETELSNYESYTKDTSAQDEIKKLEARKLAINKQINQDIIDNKVKKSKKIITDAISFYAEKFKAENHAELIQFNEKDLTLTFVSESGRADALYEIGSGSNFMAYHISTILAFHEFFLGRTKHPAPNFVFFDQPTQVYFPETDIEISEKSEDVTRVRRIFEVLNEAVKRTKNQLQIIILEHVGEYAWTGFENIIKVKRWRDDESDEDDRALIPNSWFD
ncbi:MULTISPECIES: DUF3732 domain-containing protein [Sphingobacterium]|uniref:DUF3732 domain-containing protein n=1 Tax=Sphingobacterium TaxID=28453 RepID=UPI000E9542CA|nr:MULTISPECIES: DUF3732 domain-containing protein [Sphingobacterium]HAF36268.1 hypothetical protein [Sphingobacterium sp.]HBI86461.1 hypothetical protein [Sphingobacterium sp.]